MFKFIEGLPPDVLAIEAAGKVTHEDYRGAFIPKAEAMMAKGPIKMLYVIGKDFTGYELEAMWDDGAFGIKHWHEFKRVAVVTDRHGCARRSACSRRSFRRKCACSDSPNCPTRKSGSRARNVRYTAFAN